MTLNNLHGVIISLRKISYTHIVVDLIDVIEIIDNWIKKTVITRFLILSQTWFAAVKLQLTVTQI
jgi:hypothetical protein